MSRINLLQTGCQEIYHFFFLQDQIKSTYIEANRRLVEAVGTRMPFDRFECFWFNENVNADNSQENMALLDCEWVGDGRLRFPVLKGLAFLLPHWSESELLMYVLGADNKTGPKSDVSGLLAIIVAQLLPKDLLPAIYDDQLVIYPPAEMYRLEWKDLIQYNQAYFEAKRLKLLGSPKKSNPVDPGTRSHPESYHRAKPAKPHLSLVPKREGRRSAGRDLKLAWLPAELLNLKSYQRLSLGAQEVYRIYRTYSKIPEGKSRYRYIQTGVAQTCQLLDQRKKDILRSGTPELRKRAARMGVSDKSVKRYLSELLKEGWLIRILQGYPGQNGVSAPRVNKFLLVMSERQRFKLMKGREERKKDR